MGAKWTVRAVRVKGQLRWVWLACSPQSVDVVVPSLSVERFKFRSQREAFAFALEQFESAALSEATA